MRRSIRQLAFWLLVVAFCAAVYEGVTTYWGLRTTLRHLREDGVALYQEVQSAGMPSPDRAGALRRDMESLERFLRTFERLGRHLPRPRWWPWLERRVAFLQHTLSATADLATAAWWAAVRLESAADHFGLITTATGTPFVMEEDPLLAALKSFAQDRERLVQAQGHFSEAAAIARQAGGRLADLAPYAEAGAWGARALVIAPHLFRQGQHTVLLLVQNSDELRATGGFISGVVVLRFDGARLLSADYRNSYDIPTGPEPPPAPPDPLREIMLAPVLVFRDANWSPDFPTSAHVLASLYQSGTGEEVSAVIAMDTAFVRMFLGALGAVPVPGYEVTITQENAIEVAIGFWEAPIGAPSIRERQMDFQAWLAHRKDFGGAVLKAILARARALSVRDGARLASAIGPAVEQKHLLFWAADPRAQEAIERFGMAGALAQGEGDYLLVVDTNMGWNKVDRHIARAIAYEVTLGERPEGRICLTYRNQANVHLERCEHRAAYGDSYEALTEQCYWDYVRVFVPEGSDLLSAEGVEGDVRIGEEEGKRTFGALLVVPPQEERSICLTYRLPDYILGGQGGNRAYRLTVQKQAGIEGVPLAVTVRALQGTLVAPPPWEALDAQTLLLKTHLEADLAGITIGWEGP